MALHDLAACLDRKLSSRTPLRRESEEQEAIEQVKREAVKEAVDAWAMRQKTPSVVSAVPPSFATQPSQPVRMQVESEPSRPKRTPAQIPEAETATPSQDLVGQDMVVENKTLIKRPN